MKQLSSYALAGCLSCVFTGTQSIAQPLSGDTPFTELVTPPYRISAHQPLPGFWDAMEQINAGHELFLLNDGWSPFASAKIFVATLGSQEDINFLPYGMLFALENGAKGELDGFGKVITISLDGSGPLMMVFISPEHLSEPEKLVSGCLAAILVYQSATVVPDVLANKLYKDCMSGV